MSGLIVFLVIIAIPYAILYLASRDKPSVEDPEDERIAEIEAANRAKFRLDSLAMDSYSHILEASRRHQQENIYYADEDYPSY